jgi:hypothetical protein
MVDMVASSMACGLTQFGVAATEMLDKHRPKTCVDNGSLRQGSFRIIFVHLGRGQKADCDGRT